MIKLLILAAAALSFGQLRVDSVAVDSVWNSDSASRVSRDCKVSFIPQGTGQVHAALSVSSDGGATWWSSPDSAFAVNGGLCPIMACGVKQTVTVRVLGGDRDNFVVRIKVRQPNPANWPAWRKAMTSPNTIYNISDNTLISLTFTFPGGTIPTQFSNADGQAGTGGTIFGYGGGQVFRGVGDYGVLVFGSGGENFAGNMTGGLNLNGATAHYEVWQQPSYSLASGAGVEFYWSPAEAAALPSNRRFTLYNFDTTAWDRVFPVAVDGWVYSYPMKYVEPLPGVPLGQYRYDQHCFIPAEYTGLGTGVWFIPSAFFMTPGFYYGSSNALMTDFWPSGRKKWYAHYQREDNKAWAHLDTPIPEYMGTGGFGGEVVGFSEKHRKVVAPLMGTGSQTGVFDCSRGVANGSWSLQARVERGYGSPDWAYVKIGKSALSNGHPRNRAFHVWFTGPYNDVPSGFNILDLDDPVFPVYKVMKSGLKGTGERIGLHYVPNRDKFYLFGVADTAYCQAVTIPDDLSDTANYIIEEVPLAKASGVDLPSSYTEAGFVQYVETLDCFVFLATNSPAKAFFIE